MNNLQFSFPHILETQNKYHRVINHKTVGRSKRPHPKTTHPCLHLLCTILSTFREYLFSIYCRNSSTLEVNTTNKQKMLHQIQRRNFKTLSPVQRVIIKVDVNKINKWRNINVSAESGLLCHMNYALI